MPLNPSDIWQENKGVPSLEVIQRYLDGHMDREEAFRFEKLMASSELVSDAVEGLRLEKTKNEISINEINDLIDQRVDDKVKVIPLINYRNLAIAASFALLVTAGGVFLLNWVKNKRVAESSSVAIGVTDSSTFIAGKAKEELEKSDSRNEPIALSTEKPKYSPIEKPELESQKNSSGSVALQEESSPSGGLPSLPIALSNSLGQSSDDAELDKSTTDKKGGDSVNYNSLAKDMIAMETSGSSISGDKMEESKEMDIQKSDKKTLAAPISSRSMKRKSMQPASAAGPSAKPIKYILDLIESSNTVLALKELNGIIDLNDNRKDEALWLKSICLLKMNEKEEAKALLQQLANKNGAFKEKALGALKSLE